MILQGVNRTLDLSTPKIMGILNVTPDSFSDGGLYQQVDAALKQASLMCQHGASIIDIGGESTRPGADAVSCAEELERVVPVVAAIAKELDVMISVDTSTPEVMQACVSEGAHMWNDIRALTRPQAVETAAKLGTAVCLMHMQGTPKTMQEQPHYEDVCKEVSDFLLERAQICLQHGIAQERIVLDPGFGFGKTLGANYKLLAHIHKLCDLGYPVLSALSRKSMIGAVTGQEKAHERITGSVTGAVLSVLQGASIVRVHDVKATAEALAVVHAYQEQI